MADTNPARALEQIKHIEEMCNFIEHPAIQEAIEQKMVPRPMPPVPNAIVQVSVWVGLGAVGLWAALDAFANRAELKKGPFPERFHSRGKERRSLMELEDIRNLCAHNYAGNADNEYFNRKQRYVLKDREAKLSCGAQFIGDRLSLDLCDLRYYAKTARSVLERFL